MSRSANKISNDLAPSPGTIRRLRKRLLDWYSAGKRDLPWRRTSDPYAILVSEFMLQQTQVQTALPYFLRFQAAFPTIRDLAAAREETVLREWAGLGYYSRARNLHATAQKIVHDYDGKVPRTYSELLFLPGIGPYAAGAIASIAFGAAVPAVDANVVRVLSRLFTIGGSPKSPRVRKSIEQLAATLVPPDRPGDFNQGLMELGACVCKPSGPLCESCPLQALCLAFASGQPEAYPEKIERRKTVQVEEICAVVRNGNMLFLQKGRDRYRNMFEFPHWVRDGKQDGAKQLAAELQGLIGAEMKRISEWAEIRHQLTHHDIRKKVYLCEMEPGEQTACPESEADDFRWVSAEEAASLPLGAPSKRILGLLRQDTDDLFGF